METVPIKLNNCQTSSFLFVTSIYVEFLKHIENVHYFKKVNSMSNRLAEKCRISNNIFVFFFDLLCLDLICLFCFVYIMFCWTLQILDMLVNFESIDLIERNSEIQVVEQPFLIVKMLFLM